MNNFLPRAIPLITVDPYFNIWSFNDRLYDDAPRHWTGKRNALTGYLKVDGIWYGYMGKTELNGENYYIVVLQIKRCSIRRIISY